MTAAFPLADLEPDWGLGCWVPAPCLCEGVGSRRLDGEGCLADLDAHLPRSLRGRGGATLSVWAGRQLWESQSRFLKEGRGRALR